MNSKKAKMLRKIAKGEENTYKYIKHKPKTKMVLLNKSVKLDENKNVVNDEDGNPVFISKPNFTGNPMHQQGNFPKMMVINPVTIMLEENTKRYDYKKLKRKYYDSNHNNRWGIQ